MDDLGIMQSCKKKNGFIFHIMKTFVLYMQIVKVFAFNSQSSHNVQETLFPVYVKWCAQLSNHHLVAETHAMVILWGFWLICWLLFS